MAQLDQPFDASQVDMGADTSIPIPSGFFQAKITASDLKQTRAGGTMIELELTLLSAGYAGRKAWARINQRNANPTAEEIGRKEFARLIDAVGLTNSVIRDTVQLHDIPFDVKLEAGTYTDKYGKERDSVEVKGYYKLGEHTGGARGQFATAGQPQPRQQPVQPQAQPQAQSQAQPVAADKPWLRRQA